MRTARKRPAGSAGAALAGIAASFVLVAGCGSDLDDGDAPRLGVPASAVREGKLPPAPPSTRAPTDNCYDESYEMYGNPTPEEQLILEILNRARLDPDAEAVRLNILPDIFENLPDPSPLSEPIQPLPPLAMNGRLLAAARLHCWDMSDRDFFSHDNPDGDGPGDRIDLQFYPWNTWGENIARGFASPEAHHNAYIIDTGIDGRGHRVNCLGNPGFVEVGIGYIDPGDGADNEYSTEDFGRRNPGAYPEFQAFIVGVVYDDADGDGFYDINEGVADVTVMPDSGDWHAITSDSGGYAIPITMSGTVNVTFQFPPAYGTAAAAKAIDVGDPLARKLDCTVQESDAYGYIQFSSVTYQENEDVGGGLATITVSRTGGSFEAVGVTFGTTAGGTADVVDDYSAVTNTLSWGDGDSDDKTFTVPIVDDNDDELNETVFLALHTPTGGADLGTSSTATLTIVDDDVAGTLEITTTPPDRRRTPGPVHRDRRAHRRERRGHRGHLRDLRRVGRGGLRLHDDRRPASLGPRRHDPADLRRADPQPRHDARGGRVVQRYTLGRHERRRGRRIEPRDRDDHRRRPARRHLALGDVGQCVGG
jgi:hypothetical protein